MGFFEDLFGSDDNFWYDFMRFLIMYEIADEYLNDDDPFHLFGEEDI